MICKNRALPIAAIVVLEQAGENRVEEMAPARKIRALISATEMYPWETREFDEALSVASSEFDKEKLMERLAKLAVTAREHRLDTADLGVVVLIAHLAVGDLSSA